MKLGQVKRTNMEKVFKVPMRAELFGYLEIPAESMAEAVKKAERDTTIDYFSDWVENASTVVFEVDYEGFEADE